MEEAANTYHEISGRYLCSSAGDNANGAFVREGVDILVEIEFDATSTETLGKTLAK